jgi:hypothetical protein
MFVPYRKHIYGSPRSVTEIALLFYKSMMFVPERKHTYGIPRTVTRIVLQFVLFSERSQHYHHAFLHLLHFFESRLDHRQTYRIGTITRTQGGETQKIIVTSEGQQFPNRNSISDY